MVEDQKHIVDKVYGVAHGGRIELLGLVGREFHMWPSHELEEDIYRLPKGSVVGLQICDPQIMQDLGFEVNGQPFHFASSSFYWDTLQDLCKDFRIQIAYLDDFESYRQQIAKQMKVNDIDNRLRQIESAENQDISLSDIEIRDLREEQYKAEIEAQVIHEIEREQRILENMAKFRPNLAVIGQGHGDIFALKPEMLAEKGIGIGDYWMETAEHDDPGWYLANEPDKPHPTIAVPGLYPNEKFLFDRDILERRLRSVTTGRIMGKGRPNYIGTWKLECPARGLFEMYGRVQPGTNIFRGRIEDANGTADFEGIKDGYVFVKFDKTYRSGEHTDTAIPSTMRYVGCLIGKNRYAGHYYSEYGGGEFILNKGSVLKK